ncbi:ESX secretion-associated protein EspG [Actinokineospora inagensis]|uniref:ESX secretion-associated protein EspG n=1 Tax=Actinokineospora inagensis TaxID=103730 RepID=UPI00146FB8A1|nr:ESX secretion-associated protein EspG [Actinokineospora inagensis]
MDALRRVVAAEGLGELHVTLAPTPVWVPKGSERAGYARAVAELRGSGKVDGDRVDADLLATFAVLCRPHVEYYGWISTGDQTTAVLVAAAGRDAVVAVRAQGAVHLRPTSPDRLADTLVAQTPDVRAARGRAVTVTPVEPSRRFTSSARRPPEVLAAQRIVDLPVTGGGQLYAAVGRRRAANPVRYVDSVAGRWLNVTLPDERVVIAPGSRRALADRLRALHETL